MSKHPLEHLAPASRILRRAQIDPLTFSLLEGDILVRNEGYDNPENHEYLVRIVDGLPTTCTCPAYTTYSGPCKHQVAVAIRRRVLDAAIQMQVLADGGRVPPERDEDDDEDASDEVWPGCEHLTDEFPCWECVESERRALPDKP